MEEKADEKCELLGGSFALFVQVFLASVVVCTLYVKWVFERPRRPKNIWALDSAKQGFGAGTGHLLNIFLALFLSHLAQSESNECAWYALNHTIDTVLGVPLSYYLLQFFQSSCNVPRTGEYYDLETYQVDHGVWLKQAFLWMTVVVTTKLLLLIPLYLLNQPLTELGVDIMKPLDRFPRFELILVMILWPAICNSFQFYVIDGFLKRKVDVTYDPVVDRGELLDESSIPFAHE